MIDFSQSLLTHLYNTPIFYALDSPFIFVTAAAMTTSLLISFYLWVLYFAVLGVKCLLRGRLGAGGGYYCWYCLLLCLPLSFLSINDNITLPVYFFYLTDTYSMSWLICSLLAVIWFFVTLYKVEDRILTNIKLAQNINRMRRCTELDGLAGRAASAFGIRPGRVQVVAADRVGSPVSYGVLKKSILLPADYEDRYTEHELYLLLLHEMAHIQNGDTVKLFFISLAEFLLFLPPKFYHQFTKDSEILCDSKVMHKERSEQDTYGDLLIRACEIQSSPIKGLAFSDSYHAMTDRLDALYDFTPRAHRTSGFGLAVAALSLLSFFYLFMTPNGWMTVYGGENSAYEVFVAYEGEEITLIMQQYIEAGSIGPEAVREAEAPKAEKPGKEYFAEAAEWLPDGSLRIDKVKLRDDMSEWNQADVNCVVFHLPLYEISFKDYRTSMSHSATYFMSELALLDEDAGGQERYELVKPMVDWQAQLLMLASH